MLFAVPANALAESRYSVRNGTTRTFSCGLRHERRSIIERFVLLSGAEWQQAAVRDGTRTLLCDSAKATQRWRMQSGVPYVLREDRRTGRIVLHSLASAR